MRIFGLGLIARWITVAVPACVIALACACGNTEYISVEKQTPKRPIGDGCVVDAECDTGRCVAGACADTGCASDAECRNDEFCVLGECELVDDFECQPDQAPLLSISTTSLDFAQVAIGQTGNQTVTIENIGDCLLTLSAAGLAGDPGFDCEPCNPSVYPQRVPPQRTLEIDVSFSPLDPGEKNASLFIDTDDVTAGDQGQVEVALHAAYDGTPLLLVTPNELNFAFVAFTPGGTQGTRTETVEVTNRGSGNAALIIERIFLDEGTVFSVPADIDAITPDTPLILPPYNANDPSTTFTVAITFQPSDNRDYDDVLFVRATGDDNFPVYITGNSLGPPVLQVSANDIEYRCLGQPNDACPVGEAYPVGFVAFRQVFVQNLGQSEMPLNLTLSSGSGDFVVSPSFLPPVQPGATIPLTLIYNPSSPSDPANPQNPQDSVEGFLNVLEPTTGTLEVITLHGFARRAQNDAVLKLEMEFENADNGWTGNDFRDVDLELVSPLGFSCAKPIRTLGNDANGNLVVLSTEDLCADWNLQGSQGVSNWIALGQYEEPERILVYGLGPTGAEGGTFIARAHYIEDCANLPTGLFADILGIGASVLLGILGGAVGVPIAVPPDQISAVIANNCFDHASSLVTLHISIDGTEVAAPQVNLDARGTSIDIAHLQRVQGTFCDPLVGIPCP